jgi:nucleoside 2-deoxyribosyltransferase
MKIFVSASYSDQVNYKTREVFADYRTWLENVLDSIESQGHTVFCALRADQYRISDADPAAAFSLDMKHITESDAMIALLNDKISAGVQTEIGVGVALKKPVILARSLEHKLAYFNAAMLKAGVVKELMLPLTPESLQTVFKA